MKFYRYLTIMCILGIACSFTIGCDKMEKPVMDAMDMAMVDDTQQPETPTETDMPTEMDDGETPADPMVEDDVDTATTFTIAAGNRFTLDVNVENTQNLAAFVFNSISFAPNVLEAVNVTHSDFFKSDELEAETASTEIDNEAGNITAVGAGTNKAQDGVSGSGTLFSITFLAKASGETQLTFTGGLVVFSTGVITGIVQPNVRIVVQEDPAPDQVLDEHASIVLSW